MKLNQILLILSHVSAGLAFQNYINTDRSSRSRNCFMASDDIVVMINGMPGPMALETAKVCLNRGYKLAPIGFTGLNQPEQITVNGDSSSIDIKLIAGPGLSESADSALANLKIEHPNVIAIDYTHPSAVLNNIRCYVNNGCDFVMGTTGGDPTKINEIFQNGRNFAVIAPNMAKQIVAMQAALQAMVKRFPNSFSGYTLTVTESHQSSKADTSGTAKAIVNSLNDLTGDKFGYDQIVMLREREKQIAFGVPEAHLLGHAFHTYQLVSADGSTSFALQHNVCGRRIYAEGTADAVRFLHSTRATNPEKRLYNMIDVLESGQMA